MTVDKFAPERYCDRCEKMVSVPNNDSAVEHPAHYNVGNIEVIDAINEWKLDFDLGNVVKYVARAGHKDPEKTVEDLKKAMFYLVDAIRRREPDSSGTA